MLVDVVTKSEFMELKQMLNEILEKLPSNGNKKEVLTGKEVMNLLKCSTGTLSNYRNSGKLSYTKIGGKFYYHQSSLNELFTLKKGGNNG